MKATPEILLSLLGMGLSALNPVLVKLAKSHIEKVKGILGVVVPPILGAIAGSLLTLYGATVFRIASDEIGLYWAQVVVAFAIILTGAFAYIFKHWNQGIYGVVELVFAATCAFKVSMGLPSSTAALSQWVALGGFAYVVSRGLGNILDYRAKILNTEPRAA